MARVTSSQTVGPFFANALLREDSTDLVRDDTRGERITIEGRILDGDGAAVPDAMIEIWQANADGRYNHPEDTHEARLDASFRGFGRAGTDTEGAFRFRTIKPGAVPGGGGKLQAPHISVIVFARGLLTHLYTRIYFPDEPLNDGDEWLGAVPQARRHTLVAKPAGGASAPAYRFDIILQGADETVFFDV
jgi:protocatechuate 3,4-dioxygenase, alpha subunit